jgi:hypothetical protein
MIKYERDLFITDASTSFAAKLCNDVGLYNRCRKGVKAYARTWLSYACMYSHILT